jgi:hypothetical protein
LLEDGLGYLEQSSRLLKSRNFLSSATHLAINLSSSIFWADYIEAARSALGAKIAQTYSFPSIERNASHVRLEDRVDWQTCRLKMPIIYFVDRFKSIAANYYWFAHRRSSADIVIDRNGNATTAATLQLGRKANPR